MSDFSKRFWSKIARGSRDECWPWNAAKNSAGYGHIIFQGKNHLAHRIAYFLENGPLPPGLLICHTCDNPLCCNPDHLFQGTNADNVADMEAKGRGVHPRGQSNGRARLTAADVIAMRAMRNGGATLAALGFHFRVRLQTVHAAVTRKTWRHLA